MKSFLRELTISMPRFITLVVLCLILTPTLAYSRDDGSLHIVTLSQLTLLDASQPNLKRIRSITWKPDSTQFASSNNSGITQIQHFPSEQVLLTFQTDFSGPTIGIDWSPDGTQLATGGFDKMVRIWNASTGELLNTFQYVDMIDYITSVMWSPDGTRLAASSFSGRVNIWNSSNGQIITNIVGGQIDQITWNPDGTKLAGGSGAGLRIWDANDGKPLSRNRIHQGLITSIDWAIESSRIATGSFDKTIIIWDTTTGQVLNTLAEHKDFITAVVWNGDVLASSSVDGTVRIWNSTTGQELEVIQANSPVFEVAWSPDGNQLAYGGDDGVLHIAAVSELAALDGSLSEQTQAPIYSVAWSPDGSKIAISGGALQCDTVKLSQFAVRIFDAASGQIVTTLVGHTCPTTGVDWSPDGSQLVSASSGEDKAYVWDVATGQILASTPSHLEGIIGIISAVWQPDGKLIASAFIGNTVITWNSSDGSLIVPSDIYGTTVDWSPDGTRLVAASGYGTNIGIFSASTRQELMTLQGHTDTLSAVVWSPDGNKIASGGGDRVIRIWNPTTGVSTLTLSGHTDIITSLAWNPDSVLLASSSVDRTIRVWNTTTGQALNLIQTHEKVDALDWSPDGTQLAYAAADGVLHIVAVSELAALDGSDSNACAEQQQDCATPARTQDQVYSVVWSPDGSMIAISGGEIGCDDIPTGRFPVRIFSATTGQIIKRLLGMTCTSSGLDWSPDGQKLVSFNVAQSIAYIWDVPSEKLLLTVQFETQGTSSVDWSPNSDLIAVAFPSNGIIMLDSNDGQIVGPVLRGSITSWSPDGNLIAAGNRYNNEISILDISTGNELLTLTGITDVTNAIDWSRDGSRIVSASSDDKVWVWNAANGQLLSTFSIPNVVTDVKWSPDGQKIATAGFDAATNMGFIRVLNAASGIQLANFSHSERLLSVSWSPDGNQLAYAAADSILHIVTVSDLPLLETSP